MERAKTALASLRGLSLNPADLPDTLDNEDVSYFETLADALEGAAILAESGSDPTA